VLARTPYHWVLAFGVGGLASFVLAVSELMQEETLSPALQFLAGGMLLTVAWAISRTRNFVGNQAARPPLRPSQGLALFLAGFSTAASNPVTIAYFAAALVPIGRITALEGKSNLAIILIITGTAVVFWTLCAVLMARPTMRGFVQRRRRRARAVGRRARAHVALEEEARKEHVAGDDDARAALARQAVHHGHVRRRRRQPAVHRLANHPAPARAGPRGEMGGPLRASG
jgi:threonine/homoserine/homoserine lactone efflux protein